jgi:hypothetical protein
MSGGIIAAGGRRRSGGGGSSLALVTTPYLVTSGTAGTGSLVTPSFTPTNGEVIVVKAATNDVGTVVGAPSGGSQTYTERGSVTSGSFCYVKLCTMIVSGSPGAMTITQPFSGDAGLRSLVVERWANAALDATPAVNATKTGSGAPNASLTSEFAGSILSYVCADWNGSNPASRAYRSTATESGIHDQSAHGSLPYVAYFAYQQAASVAAHAMGLTAPTGQAWALVGVEVKAA